MEILSPEKLKQKLRSKLQPFADLPKNYKKLQNYTPSAVLVPLVFDSEGLSLILTQRSAHVKDHKAQICFPGGVQEKQDQNLIATALRESWEEIGLSPSSVEIIGPLSQHYTPTRYQISPIVASIHADLSFTINPQEIEKILTIPITHFHTHQDVQVQKAEFFSENWDIPFYRYQEHVIWGATGRIIAELISILEKI